MYISKKISLLILYMSLIATYGASQSGAKIYAGVTTAWNADNNVTPEGQLHSGWEAGLDARLNNDRMYFLLGIKYGQTDLLATTSPSFFGGSKMEIIKGRVGLGFDVIRISSNFFITAKVAGSIVYVNNYDKDLLTKDGYDKINDGTAGLIGGAGIRIGKLNVDLEYEHGLFNMYSQQKLSNMHFVSLLFGINF